MSKAPGTVDSDGHMFKELEIKNSLTALNLNLSNCDGLPEAMQVAEIVSALRTEHQQRTSDDDTSHLSVLNSFQELSLRT
jgi:hypothetical protein